MALLSDRETQLLEAIVTLEKRRVELAMDHNGLLERQLALRQATLGRSDAALAVAAVCDAWGLDTDAFEREHGTDPTATLRAFVGRSGGAGLAVSASERGVDVRGALADAVDGHDDPEHGARTLLVELAAAVADID